MQGAIKVLQKALKQAVKDLYCFVTFDAPCMHMNGHLLLLRDDDVSMGCCSKCFGHCLVKIY